MNKGILLLGLLLLAGCVSLYDLTSYVTKGLDTPPVDHVAGGDKLTVSPSALTFTPTDASKTITVTAKDKYVYKDIFFCKTPCKDATNWQKAGEFAEQPTKGRYVDGQSGVSKQITVNRGDLNEGNNFVIIFTCAGKGQCNNNKWVMQKFTVAFPECPTDCGTKKCDIAAQQCVDCLIDGDCPADKRCDSSTKTCIAKDKCLGVSCTGSTPKCNPATGTCVLCLADADCGAGKKCSAAKTCVDKCTGITCPSGQVCNPGNEQCVQCTADTNCSPDKKCDTATNTCVDKCQGVTCSGSTPKCNPTAGKCVACLIDNDCGAGKKCNPSNKCVSCLADADCGSGKNCDKNYNCVNACSSYSCNGVNGKDGCCCTTLTGCLQCSSDADCGATTNPKMVCVNKKCDISPLCINGRQDSGESDVDCGGTICFKCERGKKCNSNSDCSSVYSCAVTTKTCGVKYKLL